MIQKINILEIRKDAIQAISSGVSKKSFILVYYGIPFSIGIIAHVKNYTINTEIFGNLISGISLFAALLFSIIFVVSNNFNLRKKEFNGKSEDHQKILSRYKRFANDLVSIISFTIIKAIVIVGLLILSDSLSILQDCFSKNAVQIMWDLTIVFLVQFLLLVIIVLKEMYAMQYEDINR